MNLKERYDFEFLINDAERMILQELEDQLAGREDEICLCQDCVLDMAAFALNTVKPLYRVSLLGKVYADTVNDSTYGNEIRKAVKDAVHRISSNPSHD